MSWSTAEVWVIGMIAEVRQSEGRLPTPESNPLFMRAYILCHLVLLTDYISRNEEKYIKNPMAPHMKDGSIILKSFGGEWKNLDRFYQAMQAFVEWYIVNGTKKWVHSCDTCMIGDMMGMLTDGKADGHQCCRVLGCTLDIIHQNLGFCRDHVHLQQECIVDGCVNQHNNGSLACSVEEHQAVLRKHWKADYDDNNQNPKIRQVSVSHIQQKEEKMSKAKLKFSVKRRYIPCLFVVHYACGRILNVVKMFRFETHDDVLEALITTFEGSGQFPFVLYYDKACRLLQSLVVQIRQGNDEVKKAQLLAVYDRVALIVDKFHFRGHQDEYCEMWCNPTFVDSVLKKKGYIKKFNTSAAEQGNVWFSGISHILRDLDAVTHDFFLFSLVDKRNSGFDNKVFPLTSHVEQLSL
ncbi:hypothetical protein BCR33DRAFT_738458 [Rhizoclosmatium globosum]|uniref:CxC6 like cysteine cluster associated with KDZ domain-containing protein n=1 Tax=Rhizoclosmatium globosum TaxID=329046 RepID=A0A1Y2C9K8_9FUNG|nr:hypothetical protein BCR33DRAFT_738458 [Rhizoclosmatium globosum]|eukprot:ORY43720.1 hypothetical protein BCR33DRAFT_738458 [Rhizoclosmatium globosum]